MNYEFSTVMADLIRHPLNQGIPRQARNDRILNYEFPNVMAGLTRHPLNQGIPRQARNDRIMNYSVIIK